MPNLLTRLARAAGYAPATKAAATTVTFYGEGRPVWSAREPAAFAREGYARNAIAHRCVRLVAEAAAALPLTLAGAEDDHPLIALLGRPNPREGGTRFLEGIYGHLMVSGNAYIEAVGLDGVPRELFGLRPDRMRAVPGPDGWVGAYDYTVGGRTIRYDQTGQGAGSVPPILHLAQFNPVDDHYGLSPMEAAAVSLDIHNAAGAWHKALLDNAARPSGALVFAPSSGAALSDAQFARLKSELETNYQGAGNAGRPLVLDGGLDWRPLALSPKEMDFVEAKASAAREIALAFGVPPLLLGLPGDNTHANYAEANRAFYRQTIVPLVRRTADSLAAWLEPAFGPARLEPDLDGIEALALERESLWRRVQAADFLAVSEKREAVGYPAEAPEAGA
ncbi:phage portal protein [Methylobacterium sp. WL9]|uniref:phage portal protein n=1 Tax=Methylobacterium sp. WL9 TaxID=2603898 RepID=UPI0011C99A7B|nr:phage portal protein [Methylobacterium sp. WL9]TXN19767.1 phage portal protein [Methylobacterium sp. WL9]